ncbi:AEC family transporter [Butyrivibrio sp. MC2021]|uniref:AEC family transporter n=1 Tax=Butyrivibrio sp. MC2021 TaxID=1408306 RepID=UPI00047E7348|nr:AEC family transporter [Butyrivibrio sp. MC2021]
MENLVVATNAVIPFMVYILLGALAIKLKLVKESFLKELNGVVFKVFFPFIMFNNLYDVDFGKLSGAGYVGFAVAATLALIILAFLLVPLFSKDNRRRGVITQAIFRSNSVLYAIPLAQSVFSEDGASMASIVVAFVVPIYNIASVAILEYYRGGKVSFGKLFVNILKNPLIIGAIAGVLFNMLPLTMPDCLVLPISELCNMATPLSLFVLGGTLHFSSMRKNALPLAIGTTSKLVAVPALITLIMYAIGFRNSEFFVIFCMFATPVAAASYPMAQSMDADADLAGEYVVITTVLSIVTIFFWILILKNIGIM